MIEIVKAKDNLNPNFVKDKLQKIQARNNCSYAENIAITAYGIRII